VTSSFEAHLTRLEQIAAELDRADLPLDKALTLFEEGIQRLKDASATLEKAEGRVRELVERADGVFDVRDERS
jgi:exodeoxyribonuclease VII small subunit